MPIFFHHLRKNYSAFYLCSSFMYVFTDFITYKITKASSVKPATGMLSGMTSIGEIRYPNAQIIFVIAGVGVSLSVNT